MARIEIRFQPSSLAPSNAALDLAASAARYRAALIEAARAEAPEHGLAVIACDDLHGTAIVVEGAATPAEAAELERRMLDLAWVVKQCAPWAVMNGGW